MSGTGPEIEKPRDSVYHVALPSFEGPLDLLLHLIQKHELEILDIPVSFITEKYLEYLELMQNLSPGPSWLGFAEKPDTRNNREAAAALRGEPPRPVKKTSNYAGKTYNSVDGVREFFKQRTQGSGGSEPPRRSEERKPSRSSPESGSSGSGGQFRVGAHVRHAKYGTGVVLRSEGAGDDAKLTVSFPGYGQKKFVAKYVQLEKA